MISSTPGVDALEFERRTGWAIKPEGACKDDRCVPLDGVVMAGELIDMRMLAERLSMPLLRDETRDLWCLGPESGGRALSSAQAPELVLPDVHGSEFRLSSLRGTKVLLVAWASW